VLNLYHIEKQNYVNGNGCRYVIWLQGCDLQCIGCWNKDTWSFKENIIKSVDEIFNDIENYKSKIDGVTFTGGEPFLQAEKLSILAKKIKTILNIDIQIFSGFEKDELINNSQLELLKYIDILVCGRYDTTEKDNNQKVYLLNDNVLPWQYNNTDIEIDIDINADVMLSGYPSNSFIKEIKEI